MPRTARIKGGSGIYLNYQWLIRSIQEIIIYRFRVQLIMDNRRLSNKEAADLLYNSELYEMIEKEKSKLWHLSAPTLYSLLDEEITTGKITYPEEV